MASTLNQRSSLLAVTILVLLHASAGNHPSARPRLDFQGGNRERRGPRGKGKKGKVVKSSRNWVLAKKDQQRRQGRDVRDDNKFTGRKRKDKF